MSVIRQDPTTREWVIVATDRGQRPHDPEGARAPTPSEDEPARVDTCPFCPGNEARTPGGGATAPGAYGAEWGVRVIPNKFPALASGGEPRRRASGALSGMFISTMLPEETAAFVREFETRRGPTPA